jgi:hypothetical protein
MDSRRYRDSSHLPFILTRMRGRGTVIGPAIAGPTIGFGGGDLRLDRAGQSPVGQNALNRLVLISKPRIPLADSATAPRNPLKATKALDLCLTKKSVLNPQTRKKL